MALTSLTPDLPQDLLKEVEEILRVNILEINDPSAIDVLIRRVSVIKDELLPEIILWSEERMAQLDVYRLELGYRWTELQINSWTG